MNPMTFNQHFTELVKCAGEAMFKLQSPLIEWHTLRKRPLTDDYSIIANADGSLRLPFADFRVAAQLDDGEKFKLLVAVRPGPPPGWKESGKQLTPTQHINVASPFKSKHGEIIIGAGIMSVVEEPTKLFCISWIFNNAGEMVGVPPDSADAKEIAEFMMGMLMCLSVDYLNPHLYLCRRCPPLPQGKTVLWQKAREHYVFLHKSHAANQREAHGKKVITDGALIDRAAHSRRAHMRLLRSPKFRHKQGQRIWVKSAWIGPKEWTDHSGQIYRIVENQKP